MQANCEGDFSVVEVPMMAIACLLGDYDSIFCLRKICHKSSVEPKSFCDIHAESNLFDKYPAIMINKYSLVSSLDPKSTSLTGTSNGKGVYMINMKLSVSSGRTAAA